MAWELFGAENLWTRSKIILKEFMRSSLDPLCYIAYFLLRGDPPRGPLSIGAIIVKTRNNVNMYVWDYLV